MNAIERYFGINGTNTTIKTEIMAGITTFLTMAYIIFVNPTILADAGMDQGAVFVATCLAAAIGCFIMGLYARLPVALAPGMGLNAFFTYGVVLGMGYSWQTALGAVFLSGCIFLSLSLFNIRKWVINAIPNSLKQGIVAGIGAFLAFIALKSAGIIVAQDSTFVTLGDLKDFSPIMAAIGFFVIIGLVHKNVPGAVTIGILLVTVVSIIAGYTPFSGVVSLPPSVAPTFMQLDIAGALDVGMISVIFAFLFVDLFDTSGTLIAVTKKAGITNPDGSIPNLNKALLADSSATVVGTVLGTSSTTSFVESTAGVAAGGRTGLVAVTVGLLFLLSLFFAPLAGMIPAYATAGAIFYVSVLMLFTLKDIDWEDLTEAAPVAVVLLMTPLTYSIADGISLGFITYTAVKLLTGKFEQITPAIWILSIILLAKIIFM
ncbi:NCS2 family permease [Psychrobacter sp. I-STPA6b]|uniref:NCS2 family permease n=1 Tax=Psychrobacter sp. I-STPA6b TaxID=2585718 RepID=UPI001D0C42C7|nr:NCS2 family permease [Psychrobacter sp. I-STPA6b]